MATYTHKAVLRAITASAKKKGWELLEVEQAENESLYSVCKTGRAEFAVHLVCHSKESGYYFERGTYSPSMAQAFSKLLMRAK